MNPFTRLKAWITGRSAAHRLLDRFVKDFPDKCPVCAFHRYGALHGHILSKASPPLHHCVEETRQ